MDGDIIIHTKAIIITGMKEGKEAGINTEDK
jgi:hypothetical protein